MKKVLSLLIAVIFVLSVPMSAAFACTTTATGKDATANGSTIVSHTCDGWYDHRIVIVEGGTHGADEMVDIYNDPCTATKSEPKLVGQIPQAPETYTYFNVGYPFMNEKGVVISEFTWSGDYTNFYTANGLFVIANLQQLGLQRAATARECVKVMGELAEKYGYADGGECLLVADKDEIWIFEICGAGPLWEQGSEAPGAHWAARRVPDDATFVGANRSRLGVIDFNDTENFMWSTNITAYPASIGKYTEGEPFNFTKIFNPTPYGYEFYASRREWRAFSLLAPSQEFPVVGRQDHYDFAIKPDEPVTVQKIMSIYADHLEGTKYDMTQDPAAGAFHNPHRYAVGRDKPESAASEDWEREIAQYRCSYAFVAELRKDMPGEIGSVLWYGCDCPDTTVYVPIYAGVTSVPEAWATGNRKAFDTTCAWWAFNFVNNYAQLQWDLMYPQILAAKATFEDKFFAEQAEVDAKALELYNAGDVDGARAYLTEYTNKCMNDVYEGWWAFAWQLVGTNYDGMHINEDGSSTNRGYDRDYLESIHFGSTSLEDKANLGIQ